MRRAVTLPEAMDAAAAAFAQLSGGQATVPLRPRVPGWQRCAPRQGAHPLRPQPQRARYPGHRGAGAALRRAGRPAAGVVGRQVADVTALRTGAAAGVATRLLARRRVICQRTCECRHEPTRRSSEADVISTATAASEPVFADGDLSPGTYISAMGAYRPDMREAPGHSRAGASRGRCA